MTPGALWPPGFQGTESRPKWLTEGRGGGGEEGGGGEWKTESEGEWKTESEGEISSLRRMRERLER